MTLAIALAATSATLSESLPVDIIVTATQRPQPLSQVPIAASVVDGEAFRSSGAVDVTGLNQFVPSLLLSSSSNEVGEAGARKRGAGTVGDNAGLESSVGTYVDGVYRSRAAVSLSELGPVDRIEVLRDPQGTQYGRNASAGLINVVTAAPAPTLGGYVQASYGLTRADGAWSNELWAQNLSDRNYLQVAFSEPLQGGGSGGLPGTTAAVAAYGTTSSQPYGAFLGEPRTWGLTVARRF